MLTTPRPAAPWTRAWTRARPGRRGWTVLAGTALLALLVLVPSSLSAPARAASFAFGLAVLLWSATRLPAAWVGLASVVVLAALGGAEQDEVYDALGSSVVWVMVGAFVLGAAVQGSGLATRLVAATTSRVRDVGGLCWALTALLVPLAAVVPSTSGRAALLLPLHRAVCDQVGNRRVSRALALLVPSVVLTSTICTLVGAGSHLLVVDLLDESVDRGISYGQWLLWGAPFGIVASALTCLVVQRTVLGRAAGALPLRLADGSTPTPWRGAERRTLAVALAMVAAWSTESWHGVEVAVVAVVGVVVLTAPGVGVLGWREGVDAVSWNLVVFVGTALVLGEAMIETGAARWLVLHALDAVGLGSSSSPTAAILGLTAVALTSHLYMTSHAARTAALVPATLLFALESGLDPVAVAFIVTVGVDYCLTLPVSSKALLLYAELDEHRLERRDLLRLSGLMLPVHLLLVVLAYLLWWQHVGLAL